MRLELGCLGEETLMYRGRGYVDILRDGSLQGGKNTVGPDSKRV